MRHRTPGIMARIVRASLIIALFAAWPAAADAPPAAGTPAVPAAGTPVVEKLHGVIVETMKEADALGYEGRYQRLEPALRATFDFDFMAEKAVGRHWRKLSEADQTRMRDVFARFTLATYARRFSGYTGERFDTHSEELAPRDTVFVRTQLVRPDGEESIEINYRLHETAAGWRVIDVLLRGTVSELALRRSEYSSVIKRDGFEALMTTLEEKIADLSAETTDTPS